MIGLPSRLCLMNEDDAMRLRSFLQVHYRVEVLIHYQGFGDGKERVRDKDGFVTGHA